MECKHLDKYFEYEWDGEMYPIGFWQVCDDCGETWDEDSFTEAERVEICDQAAADRIGNEIDMAVEYEQDRLADLI